MAIGALQEAAALGLCVPDDVSIVGFDGIDATCWTQPALTTIEQPIDEIAETTIDALDTLMREPAASLPRYVFRPRLRPGGSTSPRRNRSIIVSRLIAPASHACTTATSSGPANPFGLKS